MKTVSIKVFVLFALIVTQGIVPVLFAYASDGDMPRYRHSFVVSAGAGHAADDTEDVLIYEGSSLPRGFDLKDSFNGELSYIYRLDKHIAVEPFAHMLKEERTLTLSGQKHTLDYTAFGVGINVLGIVPVWNFDFYAVAGVFYAYHDFDFTGAAAPFFERTHAWGVQGGGGIDYVIARRLRIGGRYVYRYTSAEYTEKDIYLSRHVVTLRVGIDF